MGSRIVVSAPGARAYRLRGGRYPFLADFGVGSGAASGVSPRPRRREERLLGDRLVLHLHLREDVVDDLLLEDRRADLGQRLRVLPVELPDLAFLAGELPGPLDQGLGDLVVGDLDSAFSPISASTSPSRTRRSAILRYSARASSSVVSSSAKVLLASFMSASTCARRSRTPARPGSAAARRCTCRRARRAAAS